jgi:predicted nucleic acid-binding protein
MSVVLDCSVTLAWVHREEITSAVNHIFDLLRQGGAWVPGLGRLEVGNALQTGIRRKRHDADFRDTTLADLGTLPIQVDSETDDQAWGATLQLAIRHQLTTYEAAYLELALRRNLPLATLDEELRRAAKAEKVAVLG